MRNSNLKDQSIEEQRAILKQKIEDFNNDYEAVVFDSLHKTAFQGTPMSLPVLGTVNSIK